MKAAIFALMLAAHSVMAADRVFFWTPTNANAFQPTANQIPFGSFGFPTARYQQVIDASQFLSTIPEGGIISQMGFRLDETFGGFPVSMLPNIQFNLSTTSIDPDQLRSTFASNVGSDDTVVFGPGPLTFFGFDSIGLTLQTPFFYDPRMGNLLLDIRNFATRDFAFLDAVNVFGDSVSRVYSFSVDSLTADRVDSGGLVVGFTATPVPEPGPGALLLLSGVFALWTLHRRKEAQA